MPPMSAMNIPKESWLVRTALRFSNWAERWFPDAYIFAALAVVIAAIAALALRAPPRILPMLSVTASGD